MSNCHLKKKKNVAGLGMHHKKRKLNRKAWRSERGAMLKWSMWVRIGKVSLGNIADEGSGGIQKKILKVLLATQDLSSKERIACMEAIREAMHLFGGDR